LGKIAAGIFRYNFNNTVHLFYFARSKRRFSCGTIKVDAAMPLRLGGTYLFKIEWTNWLLYVSFIFVHLCNRNNTVVDHHHGTV